MIFSYLKWILSNQVVIMRGLRLVLIHQGVPEGTLIIKNLEDNYVKTTEMLES